MPQKITGGTGRRYSTLQLTVESPNWRVGRPQSGRAAAKANCPGTIAVQFPVLRLPNRNQRCNKWSGATISRPARFVERAAAHVAAGRTRNLTSGNGTASVKAMFEVGDKRRSVGACLWDAKAIFGSSFNIASESIRISFQELRTRDDNTNCSQRQR